MIKRWPAFAAIIYAASSILENLIVFTELFLLYVMMLKLNEAGLFINNSYIAGPLLVSSGGNS